jgi:hypothetical protein
MGSRRQPVATWIGANGRSADTNVGRPDKLESRREERVPPDTRHAHDAVFERLPERLQHRARELGQLVHEEDSEVPQC